MKAPEGAASAGCRSLNLRKPAGSTQLDRYRLDFRVVLQRGLTVLSAEAGHLEAAKRRGGVHHVVAVDPHRSGLDLAGEQVRLVDVLGPDGRRQAVGGVV